MRSTPFVLCSGLALAAVLAACSKSPEPSETGSSGSAQPAASRGPNGEAVVTLDAGSQKAMGLQTETLTATQIQPEAKGYGQVLDFSPLASLAGDQVAAEAASAASQAELGRLKILASQDNASARALQAAEAAAIRDRAQADSIRLKLLAGWGQAIAGRGDLPALVRSLGSSESALVRVELPAGEHLDSAPAGARLVPLSGEPRWISAEWLGRAPSVDPQTQGQEFLFLVTSNAARLSIGASVTGYLEVAGDALNGVTIPRSAVIRHEGLGWIYVETDSTNFIRRPVALDHPMDRGWFVSAGAEPGERVVVVGASSIFSQELSSRGFQGGDRD